MVMGNAGENIRVLRVVVVSPGDVVDERAVADTVVEELNRGVAASCRCRLSLWRWETDARSGIHVEGPQGLIDELMDISDADVVVGVFWTRFGTPTGQAESGSQHELRRAWAAWRQRGRPDVIGLLLYSRVFADGARGTRAMAASAGVMDPSRLSAARTSSTCSPTDHRVGTEKPD